MTAKTLSKTENRLSLPYNSDVKSTSKEFSAGALTTFFENKDEKLCPVSVCKLMKAGCKDPAVEK